MAPAIITIILVILSFIASYTIGTAPSLQLSDGETVSSLIAVFACLVASISATYVISSYIQTNKAFLLSLKPSLLIQVVSEHLPNSEKTANIPYTFIHYKNTSNNEFVDLTMKIALVVGTQEIDLSDLFKEKMSMAAQDQRHKRIDIYEVLGQRGVEINQEVESGNSTILTTGYEYTFNGKTEKRVGAEYKWNASIQHWELR